MSRIFLMLLLLFMIIGLILFSFIEKDEDILSNMLLYGTDSDGHLISEIDFIHIVPSDDIDINEVELNKTMHSAYINNIIGALMDIDLEVVNMDNIDDKDFLFTLNTYDSNDLIANTHPLVTQRIYILDNETIVFKGLLPIAGFGNEKLYTNKSNVEANILNIIKTLEEYNRVLGN